MGAEDLAGLTVLVTRPGEPGEVACTAIRAAGGQALLCPCLEERPPSDPGPLRAALAEVERFAWVAVTSQSAARALIHHLTAPSRARLGRLAAVGPHTAAVLRAAGLPVVLVAEGEAATGAGLAKMLQQGGQSAAGEVLLPRAEEGREELATALQVAGVAVTAVAAYRTVAVPAERLAPACQALRSHQMDLVPLASPRTAAVLLAALGADAAAVLAGACVGAIGATTAAALRGAGVRVDVVGRGDFMDLVAALGRFRLALRRLEC